MTSEFKVKAVLNVVEMDRLLKERGMSLGALARETGMDRSSITRLRNATRSPKPETLLRIAKAIECKIDDLVTLEKISNIDSPVLKSSSGNSVSSGQHHATLRAMAMMRYGLICACCNESEYHFLTIDHVKPGYPYTGLKKDLYMWLNRNSYPSGFQTLCFNCNSAKGDRPQCPHGTPVTFTSDASRYRWNLKKQVFNVYGGKCACCNETDLRFLAIDHVSGGGKAHRESLGNNMSGHKLYTELRKLGFPNNPPLRVLCHNCNHATAWGECPHQYEK